MFFPSLFGAIIPTLLLVWLIWWADRYEREPVKLLAAAFFWGAIPSIILALITELILIFPFDQNTLGGQFASMAIIAPFVEETLKGLALLGLLIFMRPEIDGVLDGIIYGALVGAGFAMTENFFYYLGQEDAASLQWLVFMRAGVFGLNHIFYTAVFGASVGLAAHLNNRISRLLAMGMGLVAAIMLHMFHNASTVLIQISPIFIITSTFFLWSGLAVFLLLVILLLARERRIIRTFLSKDQARSLTDLQKKRLMATLPPPERFLPAVLLPAQAQHRASIYQTVAELAFRWHRLPKAKENRAKIIVKEINDLQQQLDQLTAT